ncbi:MAG: Lrp/AsnC family transcriptional regulator [Cyanobacteria bacterium]|nr:Lrp/AsnC family transcriptional regulator [Cyanobacteriota bacterium]
MNEANKKQLLSLLEQNASLTPETLASMMQLPVDEVKNLKSELEQDGILKQYRATVDWHKVGIDKILAFIDVKVVPAREVGFDAVAMRIARYPEVRSAWLVSGGADLRVMVEAMQINELASFVAEKIATIDGVTGTNTHFLLRKYKEDYALFEEPEKDNRLVVS